MAEHDTHPVARASRDLKPGYQSSGAARRGPCLFQGQGPVRAAIAQSREAVGDESQAIPAGQALGPALRCIAIHAPQEFPKPIPAQAGLDLGGTTARLCHIPLGWEASMEEGIAQRRIMVHQGSAPQPVEQLVPVVGRQHRRQGTRAVLPGGPGPRPRPGGAGRDCRARSARPLRAPSRSATPRASGVRG